MIAALKMTAFDVWLLRIFLAPLIESFNVLERTFTKLSVDLILKQNDSYFCTISVLNGHAGFVGICLSGCNYRCSRSEGRCRSRCWCNGRVNDNLYRKGSAGCRSCCSCCQCCCSSSCSRSSCMIGISRRWLRHCSNLCVIVQTVKICHYWWISIHWADCCIFLFQTSYLIFQSRTNSRKFEVQISFHNIHNQHSVGRFGYSIWICINLHENDNLKVTVNFVV